MEIAELLYPAQMESVSKIKFSDNSDDLVRQLSELVDMVNKVQSAEIKEYLCEKISYGISKLRSLGSVSEADLFEKTVINIKPKWWR
jgi:hypothetical protein